MRNYKLKSDYFRPGYILKHDVLSRVIFDESPDAIFLLQPDDFTIVDYNIKAKQLFQSEEISLTGMESFALFDSEPVDFSRITFMETVNHKLEHSQEMAFKSLKGNIFWGRCYFRRVDTAEGPVVIFRVRRVVDYMKTAEMLSTMIKHTAKVTGMDYFRVLTELLVKTFGVSIALVARIDEDMSRAHVIHCWHRKQVGDCTSFDLETSPSVNVLSGYTAYFPNNLREMFPNDKLIEKLGMESFMGTPVFNASGEVCGLLIMLDDKPMEEIPNSRYMLSLFASRVGAELERIQIEESFKIRIQELQQTLKSQAGIIL